jgi:hypothetical protein
MKLILCQLPPRLGPDDGIYHGQVPARALFLHPDAAASFLKLDKAQGGWRWSDIWRSAESSLNAMRTKRGVQPPAYSGHNYGFSVDADLHGIMKEKKISYHDIVEIMMAADWYCHRRDGAGPDESESWHFNYLGPGHDEYLLKVNQYKPATWSNAIEARICEKYGQDFLLDAKQLQTGLQTLKLYHGAIDGQLGPMSQEAIRAFQRAWGISEDGNPTPKTMRTLVFVTAEKQITPSQLT